MPDRPLITQDDIQNPAKKLAHPHMREQARKIHSQSPHKRPIQNIPNPPRNPDPLCKSLRVFKPRKR